MVGIRLVSEESVVLECVCHSLHALPRESEAAGELRYRLSAAGGGGENLPACAALGNASRQRFSRPLQLAGQLINVGDQPCKALCGRAAGIGHHGRTLPI